MDFRNKSAKSSSNSGRWSTLNNDNDSDNSFKTVNRRGRRNKRQEETQQAARRRENLPGTMPLPGIDPPPQKSNKYVAPGKRSRDNTPNKKRGLEIKRDKTASKPKAPELKDAAAFPTFGDVEVQHVDPIKETQDVDDEKMTFAQLASAKDPILPKPKIYKDDIKPGWVRLSRGKNGELIKEYGPEVPKSQFWIDWENAEKQRKRQALIDVLEKNMAYVRWAYPYEDWYDDESEYEDDDDFEEEWVSEDEQ